MFFWILQSMEIQTTVRKKRVSNSEDNPKPKKAKVIAKVTGSPSKLTLSPDHKLKPKIRAELPSPRVRNQDKYIIKYIIIMNNRKLFSCRWHWFFFPQYSFTQESADMHVWVKLNVEFLHDACILKENLSTLNF